MITIALRFDDPSPTSDHVLERKIFSALQDLTIPATVAVVPVGLVGNTLIPIRKGNVPHLVEAQSAGLIEVAQHGYSHERLNQTNTGDPTEFFGVSSNEQTRRIHEGRLLLEQTFSVRLEGFIPPFNTYDATTTSILQNNGFTYLSGSYVTPLESPPNIRLIPRTSHVGQLRNAYAEARRQRWLNPVIIAIMHHYDFSEARENPGKLQLDKFQGDLRWLKQQGDVCFTTLGSIAQNLNVPHSWRIHNRHQRKNRLHWRIQRHLPLGLLYTHPLWMYLRP